jgi:hypothetical protein
MEKKDNFALVLIIAFTGKQSYYNDQYMYLFTQQLYIINKTDKTLIMCLLIFLFSICVFGAKRGKRLGEAIEHTNVKRGTSGDIVFKYIHKIISNTFIIVQ